MSLRVALAQHPQHRGHFVRVVQALHQRVDGGHDPASVPPELHAPLQLLGPLDVPEVFEVLLGRGEVDEEPAGGGGQPDFVSDEVELYFLFVFMLNFLSLLSKYFPRLFGRTAGSSRKTQKNKIKKQPQRILFKCSTVMSAA